MRYNVVQRQNRRLLVVLVAVMLGLFLAALSLMVWR
jgi:hypothetical protein